MPTSPESAPRAESHLLVDNVTAGYGGVPVVESVSISVGLAEVVAIVGPNGAGKSTLLKALTGNLPVLSGRISLAGRDVSRLPAHQLAKRGLAYVPQVNDVFSTLTVIENLEMGAFLLDRKQRRRRIHEILD
jgi:branched-chain amino acid transport system ATP-binding protein